MADRRGGDSDGDPAGSCSLTRRAVLALTAGATASVAGCSAFESDDGRTPEPPGVGTSDPPDRTDTSAGTETPDAWIAEFDPVLDAVDDLDCDPSGESPCDAAIRSAVGDGVAIRFPAGSYRFEAGLQFHEYDRLGFVGDGDVTFVPPTGFNGQLMGFVGDRILFRDIDIDLSAEDTTAGLRFITSSGFSVEDVEFLGRGTHPDDSVVNALALAVEDPSKQGLVRNVVARRGSAIGHYKDGNGRVGIWEGDRHRGRIRVENCRLEEFGNNGIYASRCPGTTEVIGGVYRNNNTCSVRLGGQGNAIRGATIEVDLEAYSGPTTQMEDQYNTRAIVLEQGPYDKSGRVLIEDCDVRMTSADRSQGAIVAWSTGSGPRVERSRISVDVDWIAAVRGLPPLPKVDATDRPIELVDTTITGGAASGSAIELRERPGSTIEGTTIEQSGANRDGIQLLASNPCTLASTSITTTRYPVFAINPRRSSDRCLVYLWGDTSLERTGPDLGSLRSTEIDATDPGQLPTYELPLADDRRCIGEEILAEVDSPEGIGITDMEESTVSWRRHSSIETATER